MKRPDEREVCDKVKKGGQMIKYTRWNGCEGVGVKIKKEDDGMFSKTMK